MGKILNVTLGADPEVFLQTLNGEPQSSEGIIPGTKEEPTVISEAGHAIQPDNVMCEFNIPPVIDEDSWVRELQFCLNYIRDEYGYPVATVPSMEFPPEALSTEQGKQFGCSPDFSAWSTMPFEPPVPPKKMRYAGGHIHVGWDKPDEEVGHELVRAMDLFLGVPAVLMDEDHARKSFYGNPGRMRPTSYGVEYRTLSNFWLQSEALMRWAFQQTQQAISFVNEGKEISQDLAESILTAIDTIDPEIAEEICEEFSINRVYNVKKKVRIEA